MLANKEATRRQERHTLCLLSAVSKLNAHCCIQPKHLNACMHHCSMRVPAKHDAKASLLDT